MIDRQPTFYSIGHLMIPVATLKTKWQVSFSNNKTYQRQIFTNRSRSHAIQQAQLFDKAKSGDKMKRYGLPTVGEPHYAQGIEDNQA
ncbi:MAG: hypothetical protein R2728_04060 [Chitinophagales bacterium]